MGYESRVILSPGLPIYSLASPTVWFKTREHLPGVAAVAYHLSNIDTDAASEL